MTRHRRRKATGFTGSPRTGTVRIIGGEWRRRKIPVLDSEGLRPTGDRIRETLFNWLQPVIPSARCLDLFAGSGALGFEAASRGAREVVLVERERRAVASLGATARLLDAKQIRVFHADALEWLNSHRESPEPFDVIFLDPPFGNELLIRCYEIMQKPGWSKKGTFIYIESEQAVANSELPAHWSLIRQGLAGTVRYCLVQCQGQN